MQLRVLDVAECNGVDLGPVEPFWADLELAHRERMQLREPMSQHEIYKLKQAALRQAQQDPEGALEATARFNAAVNANADAQAKKAAANERVQSARRAATVATYHHLLDKMDDIGSRLNAIAKANRETCRDMPWSLPAKIVELYGRAKAILRLLSEPMASAPQEVVARRPVRGPFDYIERDLRSGVAARCGQIHR